MFNEATAINRVAYYERSITGVKNSYDFAGNPDSLTSAQLPAVLHYVPSFQASLRAHHNQWENVFELVSILCVASRQSRGGQLNFLENAAIPFGGLWRARFQDADVVRDLLSSTGAVKAFLASGQYGAGGPLLTVGGVEYIGWVMRFQFMSA